MDAYISSSDLALLGVSQATISRKIKSGKWRWQWGPQQGSRGQRKKEVLLSDLPDQLQLKHAKLQEERASATVEGEADQPQSKAPDSVDDRLQAFVTALARFSPPAYTIQQKDSIQLRCIDMGRLCDQGIALIGKLKNSSGITVHSPGSREAGKNRAYHPDLVKLAKRTASTDSIYLEMYPSAAQPLSVSTFLRLLEKYRKKGLTAFIRQSQTLSPDKDDRFLDVPQIAVDWLRANLKNYVKSSVSLFGARWLEWARRNNVKLPFTESRPGQPGTCYMWLYRWKQSVPSVSMVLAREGMRGVENRYAIIKRSYDDLETRVGWTMDWRTFDVACWLPFKKDKSKKPVLVRLSLCTVFDLKARIVFGYHISDRPTARGVTLAYVDALSYSTWKRTAGFEKLFGMQRSANGIDAFVLWDNGKEFTACLVEGKEIKVGKITLHNNLTGTLDSLKVGLAVEAQFEVRHAKPYNAKSKTVEPFHRYGIGLWEEGMPGFCGNKTTEKPHYYKAARAIHKSFIEGTKPKSEDLEQLPPLWRDTYEVYKDRYGFGTPFLSEPDFRAAFQKQMIAYNQQPHSALANERGEMSPIEYLNLFGGEPHEMRADALAGLLMESRLAQVEGDRITLRWFGESFDYKEVASKLSDGTALMRLPEKTKVEVRINPDDLGRALVMANRSTLCWIESPRLLGWNASREDFQQANADKKRAKQVAKEFFNTQQPSDWRDYAAERLPEALPLAVGAEDDLPIPLEPPESKPASVTVLTRYDRKSPDAPQSTHSSEISHLRAVPSQVVRDEFENDLKTFIDEEEDDTEIKAGWE